MLKELYIKNLAVISEAVIPFTDSFNVFTGETGAGKSILINGINAVLGQRATKDIVRAGCEKAVITALFTELSRKVIEKLDELGISHDDNQITLTREISSDGGSVARVNSRASTVSVLRDIGELLVNIHGQHDNQVLLNPEKHIDILDNFACLEEDIADYHKSFVNLQEVSRKLKRLADEDRERRLREEIIRTKIKEIGGAKLSADEDKYLEAEYKKAINAYDISRVLSNSYLLLDGDEENTGICEKIDSVIEELSPFSDTLEGLGELIDRLKNIRPELSDISSELIRENDGIDADPARIAEISERLDIVNSLKKKYGPELSDVLKAYEEAVSESEKMDSFSDDIEKTVKEREKLLSEVSEKAKRLSELRQKAGEKFSSRIEEELSFLDMSGVKISVSAVRGKLTGKGMDTIEFLISTNKGEGMKPLSKIASGGELSRIMLSLKNVIADKDDIHTLIFDEIDTGVSGRAAQKIGYKLCEVSRNRQVLCVTHLAQMASMADNHLLIEKRSDSERTYTQIRTLATDERKYEIARITVGDNITDTALKNAEEMLKSAEKIKKRQE